MHRYLLVALAIMVSLVGTVTASDGILKGTISETVSGVSVPYASVQIEGTHLGAIADSSGSFQIKHIPDGEHTLLVSSVGFETRKLVVRLPADFESGLEIELVPSLLKAGSIVVTGTRTPRYIKDAPVFTEVVSRASIEDKGAHNLFEALDGEAGVRVEEQCQGCNFSILRMQGLGADHTQVLLDGQPVFTGLAGVYGLQQIGTAEVDQIEIVKGAGSALYGSNAVAGAINIISAIPRKTEAKIGLEFGEHGTNRYDLSASARSGKLGIYLFAQQSEQDELDETGDLNAQGGIEEPDGWIDRVRATAKSGGFNLFLDDVFSADQIIVRGRLLNETRQGGWLTDNLFENPFAPGTERIITDRYSGQLEYRRWLSGGTELHASVSLIGHKRDATNDTFLSDYEETMGEMPTVDLLRPYVADERLVIVTTDLVQPIAGRHRLLSGVQFTHNDLKESGMYLDSETAEPYMSTSEKSANEIGIYVQDEFKLSKKLELVAGLRYDYHSSEDEFRGSGDVLLQGLEPLEYKESTVNPRFAIKYAASDDLILRGSIGTGFRVPYGFSEDLHLCSGSPRVYKGGSLKPEKSLSYSWTADYSRQSLDASLNLYRTELEDAIAFVEADDQISDLGYTYEWQNIANAHVMGAELNASLSLSRHLVLAARFEVFSGKYDDPREDWIGTAFEKTSENISRYPQTAGGFKLRYNANGWNFVADLDYKGTMYIDLTEPADPVDVKIHKTESFMLLDVKLSKMFFSRYKIYAGVRNLTDYTQEEKHIDDAAFMYAPVYGRILYSGVEVSL